MRNEDTNTGWEESQFDTAGHKDGEREDPAFARPRSGGATDLTCILFDFVTVGETGDTEGAYYRDT